MNDFQVGDLVLTPDGYVAVIKEIDYTSAPLLYRINIITEQDQKTPRVSNDNVYYYGLELTPWAKSKEVLEQGRIVKSLWTGTHEIVAIHEYKNQFYWVRTYKEEVIDYCQLR